jgi:hypothetical protein
MISRFFNFFDRGLTWADLLWRLITFIVVIFGGTTTALLAKASELFRGSSPFIWVLIGITTSFILIFIFYLFNLSRKQAAKAKYLQSLSVTTLSINPLLDNFEDRIIKLSDLQLPLNKAHQHKLFKRCKIVGPGAIAILGGTYNKSGFINCGDIFVVPNDTYLTGVIGLENCTLDQCELINITIFISNTPQNIESLLSMNARLIIGEFGKGNKALN